MRNVARPSALKLICLLLILTLIDFLFFFPAVTHYLLFDAPAFRYIFLFSISSVKPFSQEFSQHFSVSIAVGITCNTDLFAKYHYSNLHAISLQEYIESKHKPGDNDNDSNTDRWIREIYSAYCVSYRESNSQLESM